MKSVRWTAYGCFGLAGLSVILAMANEAPGFLGAGVGVLVMGIGFLAADRGLSLLAEIRDALVPSTVAPSNAPEADEATHDGPKPVRTAAEISADLKKLQKNV